jgi:pyridoxamine 5'-phosphate oxidase family protein
MFGMFSRQEQTYPKTQPIARLGTVEPDGQPDVDAVGVEFHGQHFIVRAHRPEVARSHKYQNVAAGNCHVSLLIDDMSPTPPHSGRGIKVRGRAEVETYFDEQAGQTLPSLVVTPSVTWSWGIEGPTFQQDRLVVNKTIWRLDD